MRYLAARNPKHSPPITIVRMRGKYDCLTCVTAMLLGIKYEDVDQAFGGSPDPAKDRKEETRRQNQALRTLLEKHGRGAIQLSAVPPIVEGRRYWVGVYIRDAGNPLSETMTHSVVVDEFGKVFDPNPQYETFQSLKQWRAAITHPHELEHATEVFEYVL